jgi:hypothetical protein
MADTKRIKPTKRHADGDFEAGEKVVYIDSKDPKKQERTIGAKAWPSLARTIDPDSRKDKKPKARYRMVAIEVLETEEEKKSEDSGSQSGDQSPQEGDK